MPCHLSPHAKGSKRAGAEGGCGAGEGGVGYFFSVRWEQGRQEFSRRHQPPFAPTRKLVATKLCLCVVVVVVGR
jgi:hypothetical protein